MLINAVTIESVDFGNRSGYMTIKQNTDERTFFVDFDYFSDGGANSKKGLSVIAYYIKWDSLDNPYQAIRIVEQAEGTSGNTGTQSKQPVILMIDGICLEATTSIIANNTCWTNYLKENLSSQLAQSFITSFQWTGDSNETPEVLPFAEKTIRGYYEVAKQRGQPFQIIAHSWGSVLSYIVLKKNPDIKIDTFITLGSPLRSQEKQIVKKYTSGYTGANIEKPANVGRWVNYWAWNDLISGPIDVAGKNFQIDDKIARTDYKTRLAATKDFHSKYYTEWKSSIVADLAVPSASEIVVSTFDGFPIAYYSDKQYHEIAFSGMMTEKEASAQDLQYRSMLNKVKQLSVISGGKKVGDCKVDRVEFGNIMGCFNSFNFISATYKPPLSFVPDQFLLSGNFNETKKFIKLKSVSDDVNNVLKDEVKRKLQNIKATQLSNINMSSLKMQYINAYDMSADQKPDFFIMAVEAKLFKSVKTDAILEEADTIDLFMIITKDGSQYRVLYASEPLYNNAGLIGAVDIDGDGNMEIIITTGIFEAWQFEIWRFEQGNLRKVYSGTGYGC